MARLRVLVLLCALAPAAAAAPRAAAPSAPALEHQANIVLSVTSGADALERIKRVADDLGGHLVQGGSTVVTVDVPFGSYDKLLQRLDALGDRQSQRVTTTDLTDRIGDAEAGLRAARERHRRLMGVHSVAHGVPDHLKLERALEDAESAEALARRRLEDLEERARKTRVVIRLSAPAVVRVPEPRLPFKWLGKLGLPRLLDTSASQKKSYRLDGMYSGGIFLQGGYTPDADKLGGARALGALGVTFRAMGDPDPVAPFGGFDAALGGGGGFLYGLQSMLGVGIGLGRRVGLGVGSGPGIDGITSTIPFGVSFPIETWLSLDLFKWMGARVRVHDGWVLAASAREHGAPAAPFGDEASAELTLAFGSRHGGTYSQNREGPSLGFSVRQTMGATLYLVNLGFSAHESNFTERY